MKSQGCVDIVARMLAAQGGSGSDLPEYTAADKDKSLTVVETSTPITEVLPGVEYNLASLTKEELETIIGTNTEVGFSTEGGSAFLAQIMSELGGV